MEGRKLTRSLLILSLLAATASAQPISAASGGSGTLALFINWGQVAVESLLEWAKKVLFHTEEEVYEPTGSSHKILITTGLPYELGKTTKIIDLQNDNFACNLPDYPIEMHAGVGGIVEDDIPLICGGRKWKTKIKECYKLIDKNWEPAGMLERGQSSMGTGNIVIEKQLLISGGWNGDPRSNQTSLLDTSSSLKLKDMPEAISSHCMVKLDQSKIMLIGGYDENVARSETIIFDLENQQWSVGPRMRQRRHSLGCVKSILGGKPIIWVTGGSDENYNELQSTEYLEDLDQGWKSGPDLPYPLDSHRMVTSEDFKAVYVTGGDGRQNNGELIEMKCSGSTPDTCAFKLSTTNRVNRYGHIALPITDSLADKLCT